MGSSTGVHFITEFGPSFYSRAMII